MSFNYVVTAQKPTSVTHSLRGRFTSPNDQNLILAKSTRLEIHTITPDGLLPVIDVNVYGRITILKLLKPQNSSTELLFLCTQRYEFCILAYNKETNQLVTKTNGNVKDAIGRTNDMISKGSIDPLCRMIGLHIYEGYLKVLPLNPQTGDVQDPFNIRMDELHVIDVKFLYGTAQPTICVLYEDFRSCRHVKTYVISVQEKCCLEGPWSQSNVEPGAGLLIPVPAPYGGVLIVGQQTIVHHSGTAYHAVPIHNTLIDVYGQIDADGSRYLLADHNGNLHVAALQSSEGEVQNVHIEVLGQTSVASSLSYLGNGIVYIGSSSGDSQLIKLNSERDESDSYIEVIDKYANLGPIVDFCVMDLDRQGQGQVVTCSGAYKDGSLRIVRNGIGINEQTTIDLPGVTGMWSLRSSFQSPYDKYLVQSFISEIRVLAIEGEEMEETTIPGFTDAKTLCCHNMVGNVWCQVVESEVRLILASTQQLHHSWQPPQGKRITVAAANASQILVALTGGTLIYLNVDETHFQLHQQGMTQLPQEISCLDITPLESVAQTGKTQEPVRTDVCAVGMWTDLVVCLYRLPSLTLLTKTPLGGETIARSLLFSTFEKQHYLLVGLGDGNLQNYRLKTDVGELYDMKNVSLGTQPISLRRFHANDVTHVFAASDRPTVVYSNNDKLLFSNVNIGDVNIMCPFDSEAFPECLALASEQSLTLGNIDDIQKLHIQTIPLQEQPRRIAHDPSSRTISVCTIRGATDDEPNDGETNFVRLYDDQTLECIDSYQLDVLEYSCSMVSCTFADDNTAYYVVGTAYVHEDEPEPHQGRLLVFRIAGVGAERKLTLVAEKEIKGAAYSLKSFNGKLLAGINNKTQLYKWTEKEDGEKELLSECGHHGHILVLYLQCRGDFIIVGDLMKSMSLLQYKAVDASIEEIARDFNANWMTSVDMLDDDIYIGAESEFNLFTLRRIVDAASDEERGRLEIQGEYHLGEFVNGFKHGSLVMQPIEDKSSIKPQNQNQVAAASSVLFVTVSGMVGVILSLQEEDYKLLNRVQMAMNKVVKGIGGFSHEKWRAFENKRKTSERKNFLDGDLIETFLDLSQTEMQHVVKLLNADGQAADSNQMDIQDQPEPTEEVSMEFLVRKLEDIAQLH